MNVHFPNVFRSEHAEPSGHALDSDQRPGLRLTILGGLLILPAVVILFRIAYLTREEIDAAPTSPPVARYEPVPATTGRIVSADGVVLAEDTLRFALLVEYRMLESPPNPSWLRRQIRARVGGRIPSDSDLWRRAEAEVLAEREALFGTLSELTGRPTVELLTEAHRIQQRIERMRVSVQKKRDATTTPRKSDAKPTTGWIGRVQSELTTPPDRNHGPLVLAEELQPHVLVSDLSPEAARVIAAAPEGFPGCTIATSRSRVYPAGDLAAHIVGYRRRSGTQSGGAASEEKRTGVTGLERSYARWLAGTPGERRVIGKRVDSVRDAVDGRDLRLALHAGLQRRIETELRSAIAQSSAPEPRGGAAVVLDVRTGAVLAAASVPTFDLNIPTGSDAGAWQELLDADDRPLFPRATQMTLPPGSVFKVVTACAALQSGVFDSEDEFFCQGFLSSPRSHRCAIFRNHGVGHGPISLTMALCQSCNVCFFQVGRQLGADPLVLWARRFGFGRPTGIDLPHEASGRLPRWTESAERWPRSEVLAFAIGQSELTTTPLQIARLMAAVANGGALVTPRVVQSSREPLSTPVAHLAPETLAALRGSLELVVSHPRGTAHRTVKHDRVTVAGKTGTAEVGGEKTDHAWFAGYLPADRPRYAVAVVLEHGGSGGRDAGPVMHAITDALLECELLECELLDEAE